jgi:periplasmic mercuric ion binding protein
MNKKGKVMKKLFLIMSLLVIVGCKGEVAKAEINVPTAQCGMCANTISHTLKSVDGVKKVNVDLGAKVATVIFDPTVVKVVNLESAISNAGYQANETPANAEVYKTLPGCCKLPADR